ncbi:tetratricopeptide repeat protein [Pseudomaricurvus sp. HS19]|uniref:tetratricopeptide repeat protein n=1 Tax=Pseudomaricurvus sp. HS19 TaxID=2692626 RepID=UPI00136E06DC|nr:tetratricopeptide repeat protein [Pseudomaricurvus sp. HS19]
MSRAEADNLLNAGRWLRRLPLLLLPCLLVACAPGVQKPASSGQDDSIYFTENRSIDAAVRREFAQAVELMKVEQYTQAITILERVAKQTPNNSAPYINLAIAYSRLDKNEQAEASFQQALAINPNHPVALNEMALFYRGQGRFQEARQLYEKVVARYPEYMPARMNFGILCDLYLNDTPCAIREYEAYSEAHPEDETVKLWVATLRRKLEG